MPNVYMSIVAAATSPASCSGAWYPTVPRSRVRARVPIGPSQAEIDDHGTSVAQQHVAGLQIEMDEPASVQVCERPCDLFTDGGHVGQLERAVLDDQRLQRRSFDVLEDEMWNARAGPACIEVLEGRMGKSAARCAPRARGVMRSRALVVSAGPAQLDGHRREELAAPAQPRLTSATATEASPDHQ